jgi:hypothetical protein
MERTCSLTLDLEADHGWRRPYRWEALARTEPLQALLDAWRVPLTVFATGEALERPSPLWDWLEGRGDEIGLHSWSHPRPGQPFDPTEVQRAVAVYRRRFGREPSIWRPPYGRMKPGEARALLDAGIRRVSTFGWGEAPRGLEDRPVGRALGLPLCLSHLAAIGAPMRRRIPARSVICAHLHDLVPTAARARLPLPLRAYYWLGARQGEPLSALARLLGDLEARGTRFVPLW